MPDLCTCCSRAVGWRFGKHLGAAVPLVIQFLTNAEEGSDELQVSSVSCPLYEIAESHAVSLSTPHLWQAHATASHGHRAHDRVAGGVLSLLTHISSCAAQCMLPCSWLWAPKVSETAVTMQTLSPWRSLHASMLQAFSCLCWHLLFGSHEVSSL